MKRILLAAIAAAAISTPAFAQAPVTSTIDITGAAQPKCGVSSTAATVTLSGDLSATDGSLNAAAVAAGSQNLGLSAFCTGTANTIAIDANPLVRSGTTPAGTPSTFGTSIDYTAAFSGTGFFGGGSLSNSTTSASATTQGNVPPFSVTGGTITLSNAALSGAATKVLAGNYAGTVTVTLTPGGL